MMMQEPVRCMRDRRRRTGFDLLMDLSWLIQFDR